MNTFKPSFNVGSSTDYKKALEELHEELSSVTKNISYLDVYNITEVVTDKNHLSAKIAALSNNSSLVINTPSFFTNGEFYSTGDVILKNALGKIIHIKAQTGGVYYPTSIIAINDASYEIIYKYSPNAPVEEESNGENSFAKTIKFELEAATSSPSIYGIWEQVLETEDNKYKYTFSTAKKEEIIIEPQIQFWLVEEEKIKEQLYCEYSLTEDKDEGKWIVEPNVPVLSKKLYIKVK